MSAKTDIDKLTKLPDDEIQTRMSLAAERVETRIERAQAMSRDLTEREAELCRADRAELEALRSAVAIKDHEQRTLKAIDTALTEHRVGMSAPLAPSLLVSQQHLEQHAAALRDGRPFGAVEMRARVTAAADLGSAGAWHAGMPNEPRHLIKFAGIPVSPLTGRTAQLPAYTGPTSAVGADESTSHGEYDSVAPVNLTALRYGRWTAVSSLANVVDDLLGINRMHAWGIARDLDEVAVTAIETAAGSPDAAGDDLDLAVREAILTVAAATYSEESNLVIVGTPATVALLSGTTPTDAGDLGSVPVRFNGARLYPTTAATAGQLTVFAPGSFRCFQTQLQSASLIDPASGENKFGQWLHSTGVGEQIAGSAVAIDLGGS